MGYSLLPNYNDLSDYTKDEHHSEYIFDIEYESGIQQGSIFTNQFFPRDQEAQDFFQVFGGIGDTNTPSEEIFSICEPGDARTGVSAVKGFVDGNGDSVSLDSSVGAKTSLKNSSRRFLLVAKVRLTGR